MIKSWGKIIFNRLPQGFTNGQKVVFFGLDFSGIQSFIFEESSLDNLSQISIRSQYISNLTLRINQEIKKILSDVSYYPITVSSGKLHAIFRPSRKAWLKLDNYLSRLQRIIFTVNNGSLQMFYGAVIARIKLKKPGHEYKNAYPDLMKQIGLNKLRCINVYGFEPEDYNDLNYSVQVLAEKIHNTIEETSITGDKAAALKLDLDNLGNFFAALKENDTIASVSQRINSIINGQIDGLNKAKLIYSGGDDIFLVCPARHMVSTAVSLYFGMRNEIERDSLLSPYKENFGMSCGICVFHRDVGLRIYAEKAENQLMLSKIRGKDRVTIDHISYSWNDLVSIDKIIDGFYKNADGREISSVEGYSFINLLRHIKARTAIDSDRQFLNKILANTDL